MDFGCGALRFAESLSDTTLNNVKFNIYRADTDTSKAQ